MAQLIVRNLAEDVVRALEERADRHGRSAEAEHREILRAALSEPPAEDPRAVLLDMPNVGRDEDFERIREIVRPVE